VVGSGLSWFCRSGCFKIRAFAWRRVAWFPGRGHSRVRLALLPLPPSLPSCRAGVAHCLAQRCGVSVSALHRLAGWGGHTRLLVCQCLAHVVVTLPPSLAVDGTWALTDCFPHLSSSVRLASWGRQYPINHALEFPTVRSHRAIATRFQFWPHVLQSEISVPPCL
jgi:hypothetical protein